MIKIYNYIINKIAYYYYIGKNNKNLNNAKKANDFCLKYKIYN
jgi:hypothetical protein